MKNFGGVLLVAACFVACAHSFPGARQDDSDEGYLLEYPDREFGKPFPINPFDTDPLFSLGWPQPSWTTSISDLFRRLMPWGTNPNATSATSNTKISDGHIVTVNETTYADGNDEFGIRIRVRVIDVKPVNETTLQTEGEPNAEATTSPTVAATQPTSTQEERTAPPRSVETLEDFDQEIPKNQVDTLTA
ncbi:icarapin-like [Halictus rubicundus]|uniref:icarapin-like n=1 Tax=Halictus rubicundus TaxID=77578 RepID=UPI0040373C10